MQEVQKSLYFHFPFCEQKCHYCDFFSMPEQKFSNSRREEIFELILKELQIYHERFSPALTDDINTVFLGGGTPSLVPLVYLERIFSELNLKDKISKSKSSNALEVTLEANPSSVTLSKALAWRELGVNRISFGLQALADSRLIWLDRVHDTKECFQALEAVFAAGIDNVSIDYILGVPGQGLSQIRQELSEVLTRFPDIKHVSAYLLTLQKNNPKFNQLPDEETQLEHLRVAREVLKEFGIYQYEVSNFAKPGFESKHNENYWFGGGYLGIGPSAHSHWVSRKIRTKNTSNLHQYEKLLKQGLEPYEWTDSLTSDSEKIEFLMLRLRHRNGLNLNEYSKLYNEDFFDSAKEQQFVQWQDKGLVEIHEGILRLNGDGFYLSDQIVKSFL